MTVANINRGDSGPASCLLNTTQQSVQTLDYPRRRNVMFNETSGKLERIIRKRKRKTPSQLDDLGNSFDYDPHWTKETLF